MKTGTIRVLLVEDEEAHAELIELSFEGRSDIDLTVAPSLSKARAYLAEFTPHLVFIDSLLPDGTGLDLLKDLNRLPKSYPMVLLTSQADAKMEALASAAGAAQYLVKSEDTLLEMPQITDTLLDAWQPPTGASPEEA